jgi:cellulose synthase/poly-beta-1,6-N-acetylglucosamine synthase-like glycosyltransferase
MIDTMEELASAKKAQGAAFVRSEARLLVWTDKVEELMTVAKEVESKMVRYIWQQATGGTLSASAVGIDGTSRGAATSAPPQTEGVRIGAGGEKLVTTKVINEKTGDVEALETHQERHTVVIAAVLHGLAIALNLVLCSLFFRSLIQQSAIDGQWARWAIAAAAPGLFIVILFIADNVIGGVCMLLGPIRQMNVNSRYYSSVAPERMRGTLPHVTIQMPVYKESLETVLAPTIESLNKAIQTYELQGGTASILVSEDGLLLVDEEERNKRLEFYDLHHVAWVARPGHNVDGYVRKGRFKKASNLNFTCALSLAVEKLLAAWRPTSGELFENWSYADETALYDDALAHALAEAHPLARASGNIRIGELILLIDCDTRVPEDCFLDAASEMTQCPEVAILQHCSGVMLVTENNYFEKGIGFFTRNVNFSISYCVANGDTAPFMGHNAFLRWSAMQEVAAPDPDSGIKTIWAEWTVSEDFEISMRLLMAGYITRWATYSNNGFLEGVSLTAQDELNRWQKYAFGVSELLFHPLYQWIYKGPFTHLFSSYVMAKQIPTHAKFGSASYMFSYYAIAVAFPLTIGLTLAQAWFAPTLDHAFMEPFKVWISVVLVFSGLGNVSYIICKYRARAVDFTTSLVEHVSWLFFMIIFFSGVSYHVSTALMAHLLSYDMTWGSTIKDLEDSNFFREIPAILKKNWGMLTMCVVVLTGVGIVFSDVLPIEWQGHGGFFVYWPLILLTSGHILYHLVLNPQLLRFSF